MAIVPIVGMIGSLIIIPSIIAYTLIQLRKYGNEEKMKMIESGVDPSTFNSQSSSGKFNTLRIALLLIGIGVGIFLGKILDYNWNMNEVGYFSMLFLCGGLGLGAAYIIETKKE